MAQESKSESPTLTGTLNDAWNICHNEGTVIAIADNSHAGFECGKGVARNFGMGRTDGIDEGAFAGIREANQSHIGKHLQFEDDSHFLHRLAWLSVAWSLVRSSGEVLVAQSAPASLQ